MTVSKEHEAKLADLELAMGRHRGRLALAVELISDAIILSNQQIPASPDAEKLTRLLNETKQLVHTVLHELKGKK
jgi:hypothetical protein